MMNVEAMGSPISGCLKGMSSTHQQKMTADNVHPPKFDSIKEMAETDLERSKEELKEEHGQPSLCGTGDGGAGQPPFCKTGEGGTGEHSRAGASFCGREVGGTGDHLLCGTGKGGTGQYSGAGASFCGTGEHSLCLAGTPSFCGATGEHPLCGTGELSPSGTQEHVPQRGHPHQPHPNVPLCQRLALLIFCIVALNTGIFFVTMYVNDCPSTTDSCFLPFLRRLSFQPLHENTLIGPSSQTLERLGALHAIKVQHAHQGWRLITCIWLHAGVVHVLVNMLSLLFIGIRLEQEFGYVKVGIIYLLSGFGGSLLSVLFLQNVSVGASGALFGLVGAMLSELLTNWTIYTNKCAVSTVLVFVVAANLAMGIFPFVDNFAHIGGLTVGFLSGFVLLIKPQYGWIKPGSLPSGYSIQSYKKAKYKAYQCILWFIALVLILAGISSVAVLVFQGVDGNKSCSWCHYLSCVPTSKWKCHNSIACDELQVGNKLQISCIGNNHKVTLAPLNQSDAVLQELCIQLCT